MKINFRILILLLLFGFTERVKADITFTINVIQQPCENDGIVAITLQNAVFPCEAYWYANGGPLIQHHSFNGPNDTLYNYSGELIVIQAYDAMSNFGDTSIFYPPFVASLSTTPAVCPQLGSGDVSISSGNGPFLVNWYDITAQNLIGTGNHIDLPAGTYLMQITDANGCKFGSDHYWDTLWISYQSPVTFDLVTSHLTCATGAVATSNIAGGTPPYSYQWSNGANTSVITGVNSGYHKVTVYDSNNCFTSDSVFLSQQANINVVMNTSPATCQQANGMAVAMVTGGTPPYSYLYNNGQTTQQATGLVPGNYNVLATDVNGCYRSYSFSVPSSSPITVTYTTVLSDCVVPNGEIHLQIGGGQAPYSVTWSTFPIQTGSIATGLPAGYYYYNITDANGCLKNGSVYIMELSDVYATTTITPATCQQPNGAVVLTPSGSSPPFSYQWSNGATTSTVGGLSAGGYSCTVTDANGCSFVKNVNIPSTSPLLVSYSVSPSTCVFAADGSVTATVTGGTAPYTFYWNNGNTTSANTGLTSGYYLFSVTDANGCVSNNQYTYVPCANSSTACYCTVSGTVYADANNNCVKDLLEIGLNHKMVSLSNGQHRFADSNGEYSFQVPAGNYTLSGFSHPNYPLSSCQNLSIPLSITASAGCSTIVDFAYNPIPIHDIHVRTAQQNNAVPGNQYVQLTIISNDGTLNEDSIQLSYQTDDQLMYFANSLMNYTQPDSANYPEWFVAESGFLSLFPGEEIVIKNYFNTPTNIVPGTLLEYRDTVAYHVPMSNWTNDYTPFNNIAEYYTYVLAPYDPNYKEVSPKGTGLQGYIPPSDTVLDYTIHFQNIGTYAAQNVVVTDTLDPDLNWTSVAPGWSSHDYVASMDANGVLTFRFENINLPASMQSPAGSIGVVTYSVHLDPNLPDGTEITNSAAIFFDYNAPVITNTTLNTIDVASIINETNVLTNLSFKLYPNPAGEQVMIEVENENAGEMYTLEIFDLSGKKVFTQQPQLGKGKNYIQLNVSEFENGLYLVRLNSGTVSRAEKLSVLR